MSETQDIPAEAPAPPDPPQTSEAGSSDTISVTSTTASAPTRPSSLPKPSGLKPPSKIGRLCSNAAPKPAVPMSPRADGGSTDAVRKLSDELSRKHLSDLIEDEEDEVSSSLPERRQSYRKASTGSTFSVSSMDALWEKHPRRLSEAGLRRSSDHSVVLTEDTDSFIIGERVWVGGTKPGQIAYIGETQFAPGDWAGIVLDDPIGKNDGSVAGVRYFQCSEKRGVFSRLTRLTRVPFVTHGAHDASPVSDAGSVFERPPSGMARQRRTLSPNGSVRSAVSSKMNASITTTQGTGGELRLGERVIVSSSRGSKAGTLRYAGNADFAPGVWAGVELDDPLGKNDGSVDGRRYFECAPRFGLFAPISKVSRSPSNRKPGQCAIHSNGNGRATPLRRSSSRDSLTSLGTSIASSRAPAARLLGAQRYGGPRASSTPVSAKNALQELLREKQHHLERLMRERELERAEVAKVTMQADRAETALALLKKEAANSSGEYAKLQAELDRLRQLLDDERQKVDDLQFRSEEDNINKEDYNKYKEVMEQEKVAKDLRIRELEAEAALQMARADTTAATLRELEEQRTLEMASVADQHREELTAAHTLSSELQKLLDEAYALLKEKENEKDSLGKSMSDELSKLKNESERALNEAKTKMAIAQTEFDTQVSVLTAKLQLSESKLETEKQNVDRLNKENSQTIIDLNTKLAQLQATVDDKTQELNRVMGTSKEHELNLNKEITKLKMELSAKVLDLEQLIDTHKKQEITCKSLQEEIARMKDESIAKVNEYESLLSEATQQIDKNKSDILELQQNLVAKTKDYDRLVSETSSSTGSSEKIINEYKETVHERDKEIIKLKDEFEQLTANFNIKHSKIAEEHKKEIDDRNAKIEQLQKEMDSHQQVLDENKVDFEKLKLQLSTNVDELKSIRDENEQLKKHIAELTQTNKDLKAKLALMELEVGELKRQFESVTEKCSELQKAKDKIETEYMNLTGQATDSNEEFNKLSQCLKETEKELQGLKDKHRETVNNHGRIEQELKQKLFKVEEDFTFERCNLVKSVDESKEKFLSMEIKVQEYEGQVNEFKNYLKEHEAKNDKLLDENSILKKQIDSLQSKETELNSEFESVRKNMEMDINRYKQEISLLRAEGATSEVKLMEKVDQLIEAQNDLNNKLEEARKHEDALQKVVDDMTTQINNQKSKYEAEITQMQAQLTTTSEESNNLRVEETKLKDALTDKDKIVTELTRKMEMIEVDLKSNVEILTEKDRQLALTCEELNKTLDNKKQMEEKFNSVSLQASNLKQQYESLIANSSAEESIVKEQQSQMEILRKEFAALALEKNVIETKCSETLAELKKLKTDHEHDAFTLKQNIEINNELKKKLEEKETLLKSHNAKSESETNKIKELDEEVKRLNLNLTKHTELISEKEQQIVKMNEILQSGTNQTQQKIAQLQNENAQLNDKYKIELATLNTECKTFQSKVTELEKQIDELIQSKEKVKELQDLLVKAESDIKQLTAINDGQKANYEDLNKQLQLQFDEYKKESKRMKHDYKAKIELYSQDLKEEKEKNVRETDKHNQIQQNLIEAKKHIVELTNKLELVGVQQSANVETDNKLEKLTLELQALRKSSAEALANSETLVNNLKVEIEGKLKDLKSRDEIIIKLQDDLKNLKAKVEISEREKLLLQKELKDAAKGEVFMDKNDNRALGGGDGKSQKSEEKEEIDGQVSFLNSVIVDMQRKNEQLLARVQALEGGAPNDEPLFNGRKTRAVAPRLFCDICDVFDAHDTEDCPRQAQDEPPAPPANRKPPPPPRPYCDICEVFGHSTENCDEEETF